MPTRVVAPNAGWSQDKQRGFAIFYDQHKDEAYRDAAGDPIFVNGRPWGAVVERSATGAAMPMPVGPISPIGWRAPWLPEDKYIVRSIGRIAQDGTSWLPGQGTSNRFRIDYAAMLRDYREANEAYYEIAVNEQARLMPGTKLPGPGEPIPYQVMLVIGKPPKSPKLPEAAMAGNKWLLGMEMPKWNPETNRHEVEVDEQLSALLTKSGVDVMTAQQEQFKLGGQAEEIAQMKALLGQILAEREAERLLAARGDAPKPRGRPKKTSSTVPVGTE